MYYCKIAPGGANKNRTRANFSLKMDYFFSRKIRKTKILTAGRRSVPLSVSTDSAIGAPHSGDKGGLVMGGSRYASFGYLSAMRRTGSAICGYTGWPRVYKPYNSTVQMTHHEESEFQGLPCF